MVNYLHCEYPLPLSSGQKSQMSGFDIDWSEMEFQTKSLLNIGSPFDKYTISEDGQIYKQPVDGDFFFDQSNELNLKNFSGPEYGQIERVDDFSGEIRFYGMHMTDSFDIWMEFVAFFKKGQFQDIFVTDWKKEDSSERIEAQEKIQEVFSKFQEERIGPWYRVKTAYRAFVDFFANSAIKFIYFIKNLIS